jgi:DMSO/TMAO reductase YedYZ molybdopterin-dependent catalytic subunit
MSDKSNRPKIIVEPDQRKQLVNIQRRLLLRSGLTLGAVSMLTGCNLQDGDDVDKVLWAMSRWNDRVQGWLFGGQKLAQTYRADQITTPFRFNAYYPEYNVPEIDIPNYRLEVSGLVQKKTPWTLEQLQRLPQESQITRLICIEGWSAIGQWSGVHEDFFATYRGRSDRQICWIQMR